MRDLRRDLRNSRICREGRDENDALGWLDKRYIEGIAMEVYGRVKSYVIYSQYCLVPSI